MNQVPQRLDRSYKKSLWRKIKDGIRTVSLTLGLVFAVPLALAGFVVGGILLYFFVYAVAIAAVGFSILALVVLLIKDVAKK